MTTQGQVVGGLSAVLKSVLKLFFGDHAYNFEVTGVRHGQYQIRAKFGAFLQDDAAHTYTSDTKGASGMAPCIICKNIYKGDPKNVEGHAYVWCLRSNYIRNVA